ncbi:16S rRNA (guanine(527)-N(7))-methyltransferase RsmG [uncultured Fenollaria sp.]|uniref:16S rRNA (guanine(527)-N(7))-methyltransferase RsmG n=1 Tax=uncultured Fenollaria sp. TaxID=1686315 RepID=UPI0025D9A133|nr:16S rRNA (guanine(527)-N(7))-methyltransferase RsmG [uncultured Fenollaria sp.]
MLQSYLNEININATEGQIAELERFKDLLVEKNKVMNLTGITESDEVDRLHFTDSAYPLTLPELKNAKKIIDVGTGAGFPGVVLKILAPEKEILLNDSLLKRLKFLDEVIMDLDLKDIETVHARSEDLAHVNGHREAYDVAISRAVARLATLTEYMLGFVKIGGYMLSMKSGDIDEEAMEAKKAIEVLGGEIVDIHKYRLFDEFDRSIVVVKKVKATPKKYPRGKNLAKSSPII